MHKILVALLMAVLMTPAGALAQIQLTNASLRLAALPPAARQQPPRQRGWPRRHPLLFGALVGLGAGLAVQAVAIPGKSGGEPHSAYLPMFAGVGAGIGSLVGLIVSAARKPNPQSPGPNP